ncbi:hypothetical protein WJX75_001438 [Coccomyxa subellipsoidea]|uniref:Uncharacterized protein n=1 Tax=Coccomyxa subellipsoidea TaxID=248742 RepID=A0ABR2YN45_9CHLO
MAEIWKMLVQKLALSLDKLNAYPKDPGLRQKVEDLVHEAHLLLWAVGERKPRQLSLSTCAMAASNAPRDWQAILVFMQLTQGQAQQLLACRRTMLHEVGALIAEWDRLWKELESFKGVEEKGHGLVTHHLQTAAITEQLRVNVHSLYTCTAFYQSYACTKVLSPVQFARYLVVSYPWGPDTLSLMTCLAQHCGERSTGELLRMARPRAAAGAGAAPEPQ